MQITAQYKNVDSTLVDAQIADITEGDIPAEYQFPSNSVSLQNVDLTVSAVFPNILNAWIASGNAPDPYVAPPPPVPQSISDRQFFQQLAVEGIISQSDALASNAAVIPAPLLALIDAMPEDQQFSAKMIISGATIYNRTDPLTIAIGTAYGWNSTQIDAFFIAAAVL